MLLIEEKKVPVKIDLVPMRSYGDKPREFLQKVPSGLLPAIEVNGKVITESQVIMELLDRWHPPSEGYKPMMPAEDDMEGRRQYKVLAELEREYVKACHVLELLTALGLMCSFLCADCSAGGAHLYSDRTV
jgi:glutathione S-transferase